MSLTTKLIVISFLFLLVGCVRKIPPEYEYPQGYITTEYPAIKVQSLSGIVVYAGDAPVQFVLVESMTADYKTRLKASLTDKHGGFHFSGMDTVFHLRFRFRGFDDYLVSVIVVSDGLKNFLIKLNPST